MNAKCALHFLLKFLCNGIILCPQPQIRIIMTSLNGLRGEKANPVKLIIARDWRLCITFFCVNGFRNWCVWIRALAWEISSAIFPPLFAHTWSTCDNRNNLHGKILEENYFERYRLKSLCMMNNPGDWGVIQASFSIAEASKERLWQDLR